MNISPTARRARVASLGVALAATLALAPTVMARSFGSAKGGLQLTRGAQETAGEFGRAGSLVSFSARVDTDKNVSVRVFVDDVQLDATFDRTTQTVFLTGHGRALFAEHRNALIGLARQIDAAIPAGDRALTPQEDLLRRVVFLWAEAPAGLALEDRTVSAPAPAKSGVRQALGLSEGTSAPGTEASCYVSDGDGIRYFACSYHYDTVCHDADNGGHCWGCESVPVGCGGNCLAECGPGCSGTNAVTWDCGDHDRCCQAHGGCLNPFDSNCGDEYGDAADDFLFASANCPNCG